MCVDLLNDTFANNSTVGDKFPTAKVEAVDKWPVEYCSPNVIFYNDPIEQRWLSKNNSTDLVYTGLLMQSLIHLSLIHI